MGTDVLKPGHGMLSIKSRVTLLEGKYNLKVKCRKASNVWLNCRLNYWYEWTENQHSDMWWSYHLQDWYEKHRPQITCNRSYLWSIQWQWSHSRCWNQQSRFDPSGHRNALSQWGGNGQILQKNHPEIRIIMISFHNDKELFLQLYKIGVEGYLVKIPRLKI